MTELRFILLLAGLVVIGAIFYLGRRSKSEDEVPANEAEAHREPRLSNTPPVLGDAEDFPLERREPRLDSSFWPESDSAEPEFDAPDSRYEPEPSDVADQEEETVESTSGTGKQKIVALRVVSKDSQGFEGPGLAKLFQNEDLRHGKYDIFHRPFKDNSENPVFSIANLKEPGTFDPDRLAEHTVPGVSLFMVLPGPQDGVSAFSDMLATARRIAEHMEGEVQDENGSTLSVQRAAYMRDEIVKFQTQAGLAQAERHG